MRAARRSCARNGQAALDAARHAGVPALSRMPDRVQRALVLGWRLTIEGETLDTTLQLALAAQRASGFGGLISSDDVGVARRRLTAEATAATVDIRVEVSDLTIPGPAGPIPARLYRPCRDSGLPLLVYFHGGGFVVGDLDSHDGMCRLICRDADVGVLSVDYRLAPEHTAPAAVEDAYAAFRWASGHADELGADPARIAVGGDSAGGNLAAVVSRLARDEGGPIPALQLLAYPITDFGAHTRSRSLYGRGLLLRRRDMDFCADKYLTGASVDATDPVVSPLLAPDLRGLPPALVITAGFDPLRDEGRAYAAALRAAGTPVDVREYPSVIHAFANFFPLGGGALAATADMVAALGIHLGRVRGP